MGKLFIKKSMILFLLFFLSSCSIKQIGEADPELTKIESTIESSDFNPNRKYFFGDTLLHKESYCKFKKTDLKIMKKIIKLGANVNAKNDNDDTPLHICRDLAAAKLLVKNGADLYAINKQGYTPLESICDEAARLAYFEPDDIEFRLVDVVEYLLSLGVNFSQKFKLANLECKRLVLLVLNHKGKVDLTLLELRNPQMIKFLVNYFGIDVNEINKDHKTPLLVAIEYGWVESVKALLECGAKSSKSTLEFAQTNNIPDKDEIINLLQKYN